MRKSSAAILAVFSILIASGGIAIQTQAQQSSDSISEEIRLMTGDIFEILAAPDKADMNVSWVLTQDRTFVEAGRSMSYRTRFVREGNYILDAGISSADQSTLTRHRIRIVVEARDGENVSSSTAGSNELIVVDPAPDAKGVIGLPASQHVVTLTPTGSDVKNLELDANTSIDTNGDGDPKNDDDAKDTFFHAERLPLRVWIPNAAPRSMIVKATLEDGTVETQDFSIGLAGTVKPSNAGNVETTALADGSVRFAFKPKDIPEQALYEWDFGDDQRSLLTSPIHQYRASGTYRIKVTVTDIANGKIVSESEGEIDVTLSQSPVTSSESSVSSKASSSTGNTGGGSLFGTLLKGLLLVILAGGIGAAAVVLLKYLKKRKKTLAPSSPTASTPVASPTEIAPVAIVDQQETPIPNVEVLEKPQSRTEAETPKIEVEEAPSWLQKGLEMKLSQPPTEESTATPEPLSPATSPEPVTVTPTPETPPTAVPTPEPTPPPTPPEVALAPVAESTTATPNEEMPEWLKSAQQTTPITEDVPSPAPVLSPVPTAEVEPAVTQVAEVPPVSVPQVTIETSPPAAQPATPTTSKTALTPEQLEKEKAKKKAKRMRYRANVKKRKEAESKEQKTESSNVTTSDAEDTDKPIAILKVEGIDSGQDKSEQH